MPFVDMSISDEQEKDAVPMALGSTSGPRYPYGLCICLTHDELDKLGLEHHELGVGDIIHLHSLAKVTSTTVSDGPNGPNCRVELVLAFMEAEDEEEENEEDSPSPTKRLYGY